MNKSIVKYLMERYSLSSADDVRYVQVGGYDEGAIECLGQFPNSNEIGWFFAGYERDIERDIEREAIVFPIFEDLGNS